MQGGRLKKIFLIFTAVPAGLALLLVLQKIVTRGQFGPVSIVIIAAMALLSVFSFFSLRFYDTSRQKLINTA
jgi:predicted membrane channel-forming protein YqfA (hemolysin III family)